MNIKLTLNILILSVFCMPVYGVEVGAALEVASKVEGTQSQTWASLAWAKESKCWLVVWREGYLNEEKNDLWCARISAEGETMDAEGIRLTTGAGVKDQPKVASDGKDFFVIWEDFKNGEDWDVYGTRVSASSEVLDPEPILISGGVDNQCRPAIAFAGGQYHILWTSFLKGGYVLRGARFSQEGKKNGETADLVMYGKENKGFQRKRFILGRGNHEQQALLPVLSANAEGELLSSYFVLDGFRKTYIAWRNIDTKTGELSGKPSPVAKSYSRARSPGNYGWWRERAPALALGKNGALLVSCSDTRTHSKKDINVGYISKTGELLSYNELGSEFTQDDQFKPHRPRVGVAFEGKSYIAVSDTMNFLGRERRPPSYRIGLTGWKILADGKVTDEDSFKITEDAGLDCVLPAISAGPEGVCLVVYSEVRGYDNIKLLAKVVK